MNDIHNQLGCLNQEALQATAAYLGFKPAKVVKIAESSGRFRFWQRGRHHIKVCCGTVCHVKGTRLIMQELESQLGIGPGDCTANVHFSMEITACQNACNWGPYINIDDEVYPGCSCDNLDEILNSLQD